jgi:hypothetical protein
MRYLNECGDRIPKQELLRLNADRGKSGADLEVRTVG